jgi:hypothetical protein
VVAATILAFTLVFSLAPRPAEAGPSGVTHHTSCEGTYGFDHSMTHDSGSWYHRMVRTSLGGGAYRVSRIVYFVSAGQSTLDHAHTRSDCAWNGVPL